MASLYTIEKQLHAAGFARIAGVDEAGRGPLAGPVCAAAVIFEPGTRIRGVNDSKQVAPEEREELYEKIMKRALAVGVGMATAEEIDAINILQATKLASRRALRRLTALPDYLLLDALRLEKITTPQESLVKGDARSFSIAAASIIAKVTRDRLMSRYAAEYPDYGFHQHKGYATPFHRAALRNHGFTTLHRITFLEAPSEPVAPTLSLSCRALLERVDGCVSPEELDALCDEIASLRDFLPAGECRRLQRAVCARKDQFVVLTAPR